MASRGELPTGRLVRTARLGGLVGGQGARWVGTTLAGLTRSEERDEAARQARLLEVSERLVLELGQMKGVAMKLGQVLSAMDLPLGSPEQTEAFKSRLAALQAAGPAVPFDRVEKVLRAELDGPVHDVFDDFDAQPFAAASIGQVHRAVIDGEDVAVKIQYPGIAEAVEADLRNLALLPPLLKPLAPRTDFRALIDEIRGAIGEELDYELEADHHRALARAFRGHPFIRVPRVYTGLSTRRVLVSEYIPGSGLADIKRRPPSERDRFAEMLVRFFWGALAHTHRCVADPHPGNYVLDGAGRLAVFDFGQTRVLPPAYVTGEQELVRAVRARRPAAVHAAMRQLGMLPAPEQVDGERLLDLMLATSWLYEPGVRQINPDLVRKVMEANTLGSPHARLMRKLVIPPESLLVRKMDGMLLSVLGSLRPTADWGAIAAEYYAQEAASTTLGVADRDFWQHRSRRAA